MTSTSLFKFWQGEEDKGENMQRFVVQLAGLADVFVNDAFGSWQSHASTYHITKYLPSYAGLCLQVRFWDPDFSCTSALLVTEVLASCCPDTGQCLKTSVTDQMLTGVTDFFCSNPEQDELINVKSVLNATRPFVAVVAGSKYDTKIGPLSEIYKKVDKLVLGGVIYNTVLCAKYGVKIKGVEVLPSSRVACCLQAYVHLHMASS